MALRWAGGPGGSKGLCGVQRGGPQGGLCNRGYGGERQMGRGTGKGWSGTTSLKEGFQLGQALNWQQGTDAGYG